MADVQHERPKRKSMFLGPEALRDLEYTSSRRKTEREAVEEGLRLLAEQDRRNAALDEFIEWAIDEWGEPGPEAEAEADRIMRELHAR